MAEKVVFKLNYSGVGKLLKSNGMQKILDDKVKEIAGRCGSGYESDTKMMGTRVIASVYTQTTEAKRDNLNNNTILKNTY